MEYCICGHKKSKHIIRMSTGFLGCSVLSSKGYEEFADDCEAFKLDNLKLVEDLAKERNLF